MIKYERNSSSSWNEAFVSICDVGWEFCFGPIMVRILLWILNIVEFRYAGPRVYDG